MAENKTQANAASVDDFLAALEPDSRREDSRALRELMTKATGEDAVMWGPSIVGFGSRHFVYESGREGDTMVLGFSPRKAALTLYGLASQSEHFERVGPHTTGKGCLYLKKLDGVDLAQLEEIVRAAWSR